MRFGSLVTVDQLVDKELANKQKATPKAKKLTQRGCEFCPQNKTKGIKKIFNKVKGRKIMLVTTAPGPLENKEGKHLVGEGGRFLWDELRKVGIERSDCDIQSVVRCFPADRRDDELIKRDAKKEEVFCCSKYNDKAKEKSKAQVYIILGSVAHVSFMGKEFKKSRRIFWSDTLKAKIYCLYHPNYFLSGQFPQIALKEFRDALKSVAADLGGKNISQYAYVEAQNYEKVVDVKRGREIAKLLKKEALSGNRITVDLEWDEDDDGKLLLLSAAFCHKPGHAFGFVLDHPKARKVEGTWLPLKKAVRLELMNIVAEMLSDGDLAKAFHHGSADCPIFEQRTKKEVNGYDYDTEYAEFFAYPDRKAYGLNAVGMQRYPQFGDYKTIVLPECIPPKTDWKAHKLEKMALDKLYTYAGHKGLMHFRHLPVKKLILRNCADADLTKRIELSTRKKISYPLLQVYKDAAFIIEEMTPNGPDFDFKHLDKLKELYPPRYEKLLRRIRKIAKDKKFNPRSPKQLVQLLYGKKKDGGLGIEPPEAAFAKKKRKKDKDGNWIPLTPGTGKIVLELLGRKYEIARLISEFRRVSKIISTYIASYEKNAKINGGRLRTKWWLTGTQTGRMSSGGEKGAERDKENKVVNLQNIHGDPNLQNLCTADPEWRRLYRAIKHAVNKVAAVHLSKIETLVELAQLETDKEKKKKLEEKVQGAIEQLKMAVYNSNRFKRLCKEIVEKYGDVKVLLGYDQGQIEVRLMAQLSGDKNLRRDCMSSDIHSKVGHAMTGWAVEKIKKDKKTRTLTKNIHFGILFGLGAAGLMSFILVKDPDSTIDEEEAQRLYDNYFKAYPGVRRFITRMREFVEQHGYVENIFGFKRPLQSGQGLAGYEREETDDDQEGKAYWGNQAINTPVQGAAHQLMLMAIAALKRKKKKYKLLGAPTLEIHDYIGWKTPLRYLLAARPLAKELLEKEPLAMVKKLFPEIEWNVPLVVEGKVGLRLGDSVDLEDNAPMHHVLVDMFIETFIKEIRLKVDLRKAA